MLLLNGCKSMLFLTVGLPLIQTLIQNSISELQFPPLSQFASDEQLRALIPDNYFEATAAV